MEKLRPLRATLLVNRAAKIEVTESGIVLPDRRDPDEHCFGVVDAVGDECDGQVKVGDTILTEERTGSWIKTDHGDRLLIFQKDVLAVVEEL